MSARNRNDELGALTSELFGKIESAQGYAYFSDGSSAHTREEFFDRIRGRRDWALEVVAIYTKFLKRHGEYQAHTKPKRSTSSGLL